MKWRFSQTKTPLYWSTISWEMGSLPIKWGVWWDCSSIKLSFIWPSNIPCRDPGIGPVLQPRDVWPQLMIQYPTISLLTSILGCSHPILGHWPQVFLVRQMSQPYPPCFARFLCTAQEEKAPVRCCLQQCCSISSSGLQAFQAWQVASLIGKTGFTPISWW